MDWPHYRMPNWPVISPASADSTGRPAFGLFNTDINGWTSGAWPAANLGLFYPFTLTDWVTVYKFLWFVGATSNGNIDVGIYDTQKNRMLSAGSTAMSATVNTVQELDVTDTVFPPGDYLLAGVCSSGTGTIFRNSGNDETILGYVGVYEQAIGSSTLPNPATPVPCTQSAIPFVGFGALTRSVF